MVEMDLKTRLEILPCGKCEDMMDCESCYNEAHELYDQIRAEAIEELLEMSKKPEYGFCDIKRLCEIYLEKLKEQK